LWLLLSLPNKAKAAAELNSPRWSKSFADLIVERIQAQIHADAAALARLHADDFV